MLDRAIAIASDAHQNQFDKGGKPYILHPIRAMMRLRTSDEELMSIAILHDVVEDTDVTMDDLRGEGFSHRVIEALKLLTHNGGVNYDEYIEAMKNNVDALRIKREDLRDNSDITRLKGLQQKDFDRLEKYSRTFIKIEKWLEEHGV